MFVPTVIDWRTDDTLSNALAETEFSIRMPGVVVKRTRIVVASGGIRSTRLTIRLPRD